jgi:hypothetical protein
MDGMNGKSAKISGPRPLPSTFFSLLQSTIRRFIVWTNEEQREMQADYSEGQSSPWAVAQTGRKDGRNVIYHFKKKLCILPTGSIYVFRVNSDLTAISYLYSINRLSWRQISFVTKNLILKYYNHRFRVTEGWRPWDMKERLDWHQRCGFLLCQHTPIGVTVPFTSA